MQFITNKHHIQHWVVKHHVDFTTDSYSIIVISVWNKLLNNFINNKFLIYLIQFYEGNLMVRELVK